MAVGVHSEQIVQIVKKVEMNAQLTGNLQGVSCSAAFDNAVRLLYISSERIITGPSPRSC